MSVKNFPFIKLIDAKKSKIASSIIRSERERMKSESEK